MAGFVPTALFGGALTAELPAGFADVSHIRQVPDNQEVYLDTHGFTSIIFDIVERVAEPQAGTDLEALQFHYHDIISATSSVRDATEDEETKLWHSGPAQLANMPDVPCYYMFATQHPRTTTQRSRKPDFTGILLVLIRLAQKKTDILVSINVPHAEGEYRSEDIDFPAHKPGALMERAEAMMKRILETFEIKNWGLFVQDEERKEKSNT